jgi:hypothetical protein
MQGDVVQYGDTYRLCYIRGPEGMLIGLAQELDGAQPDGDDEATGESEHVARDRAS